MNLITTDSTNYERLKKLGQGSFGSVFLVKNIKDGNIYVSKDINISDMEERNLIQMFAEAKILEALNHPYIIKLYEFYKTKSQKLVLILEYANEKDLSYRIQEQRDKKEYFTEAQLIKWLLQLLLALKHSHDHKIIHRDIKTSNIFLHNNSIKLGDFGLAKNLTNSQQVLRDLMGTPLYIAPEIFEENGYSFPADIWSLGIIMFELMNLQVPFTATLFPILIKQITQDPFPELNSIYSEELRNLVFSMLIRNPLERPTINDLLQNEFLCSMLLHHKEEFQTLITQNKSYEVRITENGLKDAFDSLKVYRFSQYKNTAQILQRFQQINGDKSLRKQTKSHFANVQNDTIQIECSQSFYPELDSQNPANNQDFFDKFCGQQSDQEKEQSQSSDVSDSDEPRDSFIEKNMNLDQSQQNHQSQQNNNLLSDEENPNYSEVKEYFPEENEQQHKQQNQFLLSDSDIDISLDNDIQEQYEDEMVQFAQIKTFQELSPNQQRKSLTMQQINTSKNPYSFYEFVETIKKNKEKNHEVISGSQTKKKSFKLLKNKINSIALKLTKELKFSDFQKNESFELSDSFKKNKKNMNYSTTNLEETNILLNKTKISGVDSPPKTPKHKSKFKLKRNNFVNKSKENIIGKPISPISKFKKQFNMVSKQKNQSTIRESVNNVKLAEILKNQNNTQKFLQPLKKYPMNFKKEYRQSQMQIVNKHKLLLIEKLGNKFNLLFSFSKHFVLENNLEKIQTDIKVNQKQIVEQFCKFSEIPFNQIIKEEYILNLLELTVLEMRHGQIIQKLKLLIFSRQMKFIVLLFTMKYANFQCLDQSILSQLGFIVNDSQVQVQLLADSNICSNLFNEPGACVSEESARMKLVSNQNTLFKRANTQQNIIQILQKLKSDIYDNDKKEQIQRIIERILKSHDKCVYALDIIQQAVTCLIASNLAESKTLLDENILQTLIQIDDVGSLIDYCLPQYDALCLITSGISVSEELYLKDDFFQKNQKMFIACQTLQKEYFCYEDCSQRQQILLQDMDPFYFDVFPEIDYWTMFTNYFSSIANKTKTWFEDFATRRLSENNSIKIHLMVSDSGINIMRYAQKSGIEPLKSFLQNVNQVLCILLITLN